MKQRQRMDMRRLRAALGMAAMLSGMSAGASAASTSWNWDDGTLAGWASNGEVRVENGALIADSAPWEAAVGARSPMLAPEHFSSQQQVSFDLTLHAVDGAGTLEDVIGVVQVIAWLPNGTVAQTYRRLDLSPLGGWGQTARFTVGIGDALAVSKAGPDGAQLAIGFSNGAMDFPHQPQHGSFTLDNVVLSPVPEPAAVTLALAGVGVAAGLSWSRRPRRGLSGH